MSAMIRSLPTPAEAARILARVRTRPAPRPPPPVGKALTATLKALDTRFGGGGDGLKARWREIVGPALARRTEPVRLTKTRGDGGATLEIRVDGPSATIIQHQTGDILSRVNLFLGAGSVERLRIVQGPLRRRPEEARRPPARGPLDAASEQALARSLAMAPEGRLKEALIRLGREVLRRERP
jgi:hypothetical protein